MLGAAKTVFWLTLAAAVAWTAVSLHTLLGRADALVAQEQADLHGAAQNLNASLIQLGLTLDQARRASVEERGYWQKTARESAQTVRAVRQLVDRTDRSLNDQVLPAAMSTTVDMDHQVQQLSPALAALTQFERDADRQVANPDITATLHSLALASSNTAQASAAVNAAAGDVSRRVHQLTRPAPLAKRIGLGVLDVAAKLGAIFGGLL